MVSTVGFVVLIPETFVKSLSVFVTLYRIVKQCTVYYVLDFRSFFLSTHLCNCVIVRSSTEKALSTGSIGLSIPYFYEFLRCAVHPLTFAQCAVCSHGHFILDSRLLIAAHDDVSSILLHALVYLIHLLHSINCSIA